MYALQSSSCALHSVHNNILYYYYNTEDIGVTSAFYNVRRLETPREVQGTGRSHPRVFFSTRARSASLLVPKRFRAPDRAQVIIWHTDTHSHTRSLHMSYCTNWYAIDCLGVHLPPPPPPPTTRAHHSSAPRRSYIPTPRSRAVQKDTVVIGVIIHHIKLLYGKTTNNGNVYGFLFEKALTPDSEISLLSIILQQVYINIIYLYTSIILYLNITPMI